MNTKIIYTIALIAIFATGCGFHNADQTPASEGTGGNPKLKNFDSTKPRKKEDIQITFKVSDSGDKLEVTSPDDQKCNDKGKGKGCFKIKKLKTGLITFNFTDDDDMWFLRQFTICSGEAHVTDSCSSDLTLDERLEFFVMDDKAGTTMLFTPASGQVDLTLLPDGTKTFYLFDQNNIKRTYYYNIIACKNEDPQECRWFADPQVENRGLN
jgi:hypothetical protein